MKVKATNKEARRAIMRVRAKGLKYFPSTDSKTNMGEKTVTIMSTAKTTGFQTSKRESRTIENLKPSFFSLRCL